MGRLSGWPAAQLSHISRSASWPPLPLGASLPSYFLEAGVFEYLCGGPFLVDSGPSLCPVFVGEVACSCSGLPPFSLLV